MKSFHIWRVGPSMARTSGTILVVEDDEQVRSFIRSLLTQDGHHVIEARTGLDGFELAKQHRGEIDLLISDMLLPQLSGYDLAVKVREIDPALKILFMTGYVEGEIVQKSVSELGASFLDKPFQPGTLRERVKELLKSNHAATDPMR